MVSQVVIVNTLRQQEAELIFRAILFLKYYPQGGDFKKNPLGLGIAKKNQGELTLLGVNSDGDEK